MNDREAVQSEMLNEPEGVEPVVKSGEFAVVACTDWCTRLGTMLWCCWCCNPQSDYVRTHPDPYLKGDADAPTLVRLER